MLKATTVGSATQTHIPDSIPLVPEPSENRLSERELTDNREQRRKFITWVCNFGKTPGKAKDRQTRPYVCDVPG